MVTYTSGGHEVLCAAIALEAKDIKRTYFLQYTNGVSKKTHDVCSFDSGLWCAVSAMCRYRDDKKRLGRHRDGYFTLCYYRGKVLTNKVLLQVGD